MLGLPASGAEVDHVVLLAVWAVASVVVVASVVAPWVEAMADISVTIFMLRTKGPMAPPVAVVVAVVVALEVRHLLAPYLMAAVHTALLSESMLLVSPVSKLWSAMYVNLSAHYTLHYRQSLNSVSHCAAAMVNSQ